MEFVGLELIELYLYNLVYFCEVSNDSSLSLSLFFFPDFNHLSLLCLFVLPLSEFSFVLVRLSILYFSKSQVLALFVFSNLFLSTYFISLCSNFYEA